MGADDGRDDGVDGVHDTWGQVRCGVFLLLVRFFLGTGGMQDPDTGMFANALRLSQEPRTEDEARCFKDTLQTVNVHSKRLRSTWIDHC